MFSLTPQNTPIKSKILQLFSKFFFCFTKCSPFGHYLHFLLHFAYRPGKPFRHTRQPYFPQATHLVLPSLQMHHFFPFLLCSVTACFGIILKLPSPSTRLQFHFSLVYRSSAQCSLPPSSLSRAHHSQAIPNLSSP